jgi:hypothetical protein
MLNFLRINGVMSDAFVPFVSVIWVKMATSNYAFKSFFCNVKLTGGFWGLVWICFPPLPFGVVAFCKKCWCVCWWLFLLYKTLQLRNVKNGCLFGATFICKYIINKFLNFASLLKVACVITAGCQRKSWFGCLKHTIFGERAFGVAKLIV